MTDQNSNPKFKIGDFIRVRGLSNDIKRKVYGFSEDGWPIVAHDLDVGFYTVVNPNVYEIVPPDPVSLGWINVYWDRYSHSTYCTGKPYKTREQAERCIREDNHSILLQTIEIFSTSPQSS